MKDFTLRKWQYEDTENIAIVANNPYIAKNLRNTFPSPYTIDDAKWYVNDCITKEGQKQLTRAIEVDGKAGFVYEGTMRNSVYKDGEIFSCCIYSILREEMNK